MSTARQFRSCLIRILAGLVVLPVGILTGAAGAAPLVIDFSDLTLAADSYFNGGPTANTASWTSGGVFFGNGFTDWGGGFISWNGFAYSNINDTVDGAFTNQYATFTGTPFAGSIYAVTYFDTFSGRPVFLDLPTGYLPASVRITNTTYTARDMATGSGFSKQFGPGDYLSVTFTGYSGAGATGGSTGSTTFFLGDFRDGKTTIVNTWELLDLMPLTLNGQPASIGLSWASSDVGDFGINTPTYAAIDALTLASVPEPATWILLAAGAVAAGALRRPRATR
ncbi:MAG: DUF4465 domain-containing protein [Pirellulales bacterium]